MTKQKIVSLVTKRFSLAPLKETERCLYNHLYQDVELTQYLGGGLSLEKSDAAFELSLKYNLRPFKRFTWTILAEEVGSIGICALVAKPNDSRIADIGTILIKEFHGIGAATEVLKRLMLFGFEELHLESITGHSYFENYISVRLMRSLGFKCSVVTDSKMPGNYWKLDAVDWPEVSSRLINKELKVG